MNILQYTSSSENIKCILTKFQKNPKIQHTITQSAPPVTVGSSGAWGESASLPYKTSTLSLLGHSKTIATMRVKVILIQAKFSSLLAPILLFLFLQLIAILSFQSFNIWFSGFPCPLCTLFEHHISVSSRG